MRWTLRILGLLALGWTAFALSPYAAAVDLARAVEERNLARIEERVDFRSVRSSVARQLVEAYFAATGRGRDLSSPSGSLMVGAGTTFADGLVAEYLTPERLAAVFRGEASGPGGETLSLEKAFEGEGWREAWALYLASEGRGFTGLVLTAPTSAPAAERFRLLLKLKSGTWRLVELELPKSLEQQLVRELIRRHPSAT
jgi:hypothetical protein